VTSQSREGQAHANLAQATICSHCNGILYHLSPELHNWAWTYNTPLVLQEEQDFASESGKLQVSTKGKDTMSGDAWRCWTTTGAVAWGTEWGMFSAVLLYIELSQYIRTMNLSTPQSQLRHAHWQENPLWSLCLSVRLATDTGGPRHLSIFYQHQLLGCLLTYSAPEKGTNMICQIQSPSHTVISHLPVNAWIHPWVQIPRLKTLLVLRQNPISLDSFDTTPPSPALTPKMNWPSMHSVTHQHWQWPLQGMFWQATLVTVLAALSKQISLLCF